MQRLLPLAAIVATCASAQVVLAPNYPDAAAVAAAWEVGPNTAPAEQVTIDGAPAIRLPITFADQGATRNYWDFIADIDLANAAGFSFDVRCDDSAIVGHFSTYFRSGDGWYSGEWFPGDEGAWSTITILKANTATEGTPSGWGEVDRVRFSAWRGDVGQSEFFVRNLRVVGGPGPETRVVVVRDALGDDGRGDPYAPQLIEQLRSAGVEAASVDQTDLSAARLAPFSVVILPNNPDLSGAQILDLSRFVEAGGKLFLAYSVPDSLRTAVGLPGATYRRQEAAGDFGRIVMRPGALPGAPDWAAQASWNIQIPAAAPGVEVLAEWSDANGAPTGLPALVANDRAAWLGHVVLGDGGAAKERLLLAILGRLDPDIWRLAAAGAVAQAGRLGRWPDFDAASAELARRGADPAALDEARAQLARAQELVAEGDWIGAQDQAALVGETALRAWSAAHQPEAGEWRGWWCHQAVGVPGRTWAETAQRLADNGFTAIVPNLMWGGVTAGRSELLPESDAERDYIAEALAACRAAGLEIHMWKVNYNCGWSTPVSFLEQMRAEGRLQRSISGEEEPWLCPTDPRNQELEVASMVECAQLYDLDGLHFDYIRFPGGSHCYCNGCQTRFAALTGDPLANWPAEVAVGGPLRSEWLQFRRDAISTVVEQVSTQARAVRPGIQISAAVFNNWPSNRDEIGQDWSMWCEQGWLDFVCPMDYTASNPQFERYVRRQVNWTHGVPLRPGIGASATGIRMAADQVIDQILTTRAHNTGGFMIFNLGAPEDQNILPYLGLGVTRRD